MYFSLGLCLVQIFQGEGLVTQLLIVSSGKHQERLVLLLEICVVLRLSISSNMATTSSRILTSGGT